VAGRRRKKAEGGGRERERERRPQAGAAVGDEGEEPRKPAAAYEEVTGARRGSHGLATG
jgi:hypothetical protein